MNVSPSPSVPKNLSLTYIASSGTDEPRASMTLTIRICFLPEYDASDLCPCCNLLVGSVCMTMDPDGRVTASGGLVEVVVPSVLAKTKSGREAIAPLGGDMPAMPSSFSSPFSSPFSSSSPSSSFSSSSPTMTSTVLTELIKLPLFNAILNSESCPGVESMGTVSPFMSSHTKLSPSSSSSLIVVIVIVVSSRWSSTGDICTATAPSTVVAAVATTSSSSFSALRTRFEGGSRVFPMAMIDRHALPVPASIGAAVGAAGEDTAVVFVMCRVPTGGTAEEDPADFRGGTAGMDSTPARAAASSISAATSKGPLRSWWW
mmetsp:Transcript_10731/g.26480  ORF Transcript_10731/g.26480 Transcript_10731/m.26480 type:complete len:317 (+) Transcript_10731:2782-3732(+)